MDSSSEVEPEWHGLIRKYQPLVYSFAARYRHLLEWEELVSAGNTGMVKYAKRYVEVRPKYAFATGARLYIRSFMVDAIRERYGRNGLKPKMVPFFFEDAEDDSLYVYPVSRDNVEAEYVRSTIRKSLRDAIATLPEEQRTIVERFYFCGRTLLSIADELGLPDSRIRLLHREAISRLRGALETVGYDSFPLEIEEQEGVSPIPKAVYAGRSSDLSESRRESENDSSID